jgi:N-methylhydantoinase A
MTREAREEIEKEKIRGEPQETLLISMRYFQQNYEQDIVYRPEEGLQGAIARFHEMHHQFYGYHFEDETIELVHLKCSLSESLNRQKINLTVAPEEARYDEQRLVYESATHSAETPIYRRWQLAAGSRISGPAVIEEIDSTTYLSSGVKLQVDDNHNIILTLDQEA